MIRFAARVLIMVAALTCSVVLYVHGQVAIFELSYDMNAQAHVLRDKSEEYRKLKFEVEQLKAPRLLEAKMHQMNLELTLPREVRVVKIPQPVRMDSPVVGAVSPQSFSLAPMDFFGKWVKVAQAKMDQ